MIAIGRLETAQSIREELRRRNQSPPRLFDCLQFAVKDKIVACHEGIRSATIATSRRQAEDASRRPVGLRNSLIHAQDIVTNDWETIVHLRDFVTQQGVREADVD